MGMVYHRCAPSLSLPPTHVYSTELSSIRCLDTKYAFIFSLFPSLTALGYFHYFARIWFGWLPFRKNIPCSNCDVTNENMFETFLALVSFLCNFIFFPIFVVFLSLMDMNRKIFINMHKFKLYNYNVLKLVCWKGNLFSLALRSGGTIANEVLPRRGYC